MRSHSTTLTQQHYFSSSIRAGLAFMPLVWALGCAEPGARSRLHGPLALTLFHTADLHSHLFSERVAVGYFDSLHGLGSDGVVSEVGGFARLATLLAQERARADRSLWLDSGDLVQGTAAFGAFHGEPEVLALTTMGVGAAALGNHDLDSGFGEFIRLHRDFGGFPVLAANLRGDGIGPLSAELSPWVVLDAAGLAVGVLGIANPSTPEALSERPAPLGVVALETAQSTQAAIDSLRGTADVIVAVSHLGLDADEALIRGTTGLDVVLGGHQHIVLEEPETVFDCGPDLAAQRGCHPRQVKLVHSGALSRYLGKLELLLDDRESAQARTENGFEVQSAQFSLLAASGDVPADAALETLLEPYHAALAADFGVDDLVGRALGAVERYGVSGGDSPLGNLIADGMRRQAGTDLAVINTTGIRADLPPGLWTRSELWAALPFDDTSVSLWLSGSELSALFDALAARAEGRDCQSPIQISGAHVGFSCSKASAVVEVGGAPLEPAHSYSLVTTGYLAAGGSGFDVLRSNPTRRTLSGSPRDALQGEIGRFSPRADAACLRTVAAFLAQSCARANVRAPPTCAEQAAAVSRICSALPLIDPSALRDGRVRVLTN